MGVCYVFPMKNERSEVVFVVRMWQQGIGENGESEWRGSIYQVDSGRSFYVAGSREVADFIGASLARSPHGPLIT
jgi:hypothetical protein